MERRQREYEERGLTRQDPNGFLFGFLWQESLWKESARIESSQSTRRVSEHRTAGQSGDVERRSCVAATELEGKLQTLFEERIKRS